MDPDPFFSFFGCHELIILSDDQLVNQSVRLVLFENDIDHGCHLLSCQLGISNDEGPLLSCHLLHLYSIGIICFTLSMERTEFSFLFK